VSNICGSLGNPTNTSRRVSLLFPAPLQCVHFFVAFPYPMLSDLQFLEELGLKEGRGFNATCWSPQRCCSSSHLLYVERRINDHAQVVENMVLKLADMGIDLCHFQKKKGWRLLKLADMGIDLCHFQKKKGWRLLLGQWDLILFSWTRRRAAYQYIKKKVGPYTLWHCMLISARRMQRFWILYGIKDIGLLLASLLLLIRLLRQSLPNNLHSYIVNCISRALS
jgi:hypothetical protein